jgi:hypothetical protein
MSMNKVKLSQIINDFIITSDGDDYVNNVSDAAIRNFALRGIREIGFDLGKKIKSIKRTIDTSTDTVALPDDFVDLLKVGIVGDDGMVHVLNNNKHINYSKRITQVDSDADDVVDSDTASTDDSDDGPLNIKPNLILDREASKSSTVGSTENSDDYDFYLFENYLHQGGLGRLQIQKFMFMLKRHYVATYTIKQ